MKHLMTACRRLIREFRLVTEGALKATRTHGYFYFFLLTWQSFVRNRCLVRASSLAYTTLLAMIPVLAIALSVATNLIAKDGEEGQQQVEQLIEYFVATVAPMLDLEVKDGAANPTEEGTENGGADSIEETGEVAAKPGN